jgi:hypothetical protein
MAAMAAPPHNPGWRAMSRHGFADLSPPEAQHAILELPTNRADYVSVLQDIGDYPARSPIGPRVPSNKEVAALQRQRGRWRAVVLLDDERALKNVVALFGRVFVLDPFYDNGAVLYAAWHDPFIKDEHARQLAEQTGLLVRAAPLLNAGTAVLAPDHLPGSWNPRPGWRKPRANADRRVLAAWSMRMSLVLAYWADRLDAVVCTTRSDVISALDVLLGPRAASAGLELHEPSRIDSAQTARDERGANWCAWWAEARRVSVRRPRGCLDDVAYALTRVTEEMADGRLGAWRLSLGETSLPDPAMLIRRVLNGLDPEQEPGLPRKRLRRRGLCLVSAG